MVNVGQTRLSGCIVTKILSFRLVFLYQCIRAECWAAGEGIHISAWMPETKQEAVPINVIIIKSSGINEWLLAAFMLSKREEGLSSHESFLFYTIFSWQVSSSSLNKGQECPPSSPGWLLLDGCVCERQTITRVVWMWSYCIYPCPLQTRRDAFEGGDRLCWCKQSRGGSQQVSHSHNACDGASAMTPSLVFCSSLTNCCFKIQFKSSWFRFFDDQSQDVKIICVIMRQAEERV